MINTVEIDASNKCMLQCHKCDRKKELWKNGGDISIDNFTKISEQFKHIIFKGVHGDCIYHSKFHELLKICVKNNNQIDIHTNGHGKTDQWWQKTSELLLQLNHKIVFAVDGLPEESEMYRRNQDGEAVFKNMIKLREAGVNVQWQYIVFSYNEDSIDEAKELAKEHDIKFLLLKSSRWQPNDPYKPSKNFIEDQQQPGDKIYPKCKSGELPPIFSIFGFFLPCCIIKRLDSSSLKALSKYNLDTIKDIRKEVFESEDWINFNFDSPTCRSFCSKIWKHKEIDEY